MSVFRSLCITLQIDFIELCSVNATSYLNRNCLSATSSALVILLLQVTAGE